MSAPPSLDKPFRGSRYLAAAEIHRLAVNQMHVQSAAVEQKPQVTVVVASGFTSLGLPSQNLLDVAPNRLFSGPVRSFNARVVDLSTRRLFMVLAFSSSPTLADHRTEDRYRSNNSP